VHRFHIFPLLVGLGLGALALLTYSFDHTRRGVDSIQQRLEVVTQHGVQAVVEVPKMMSSSWTDADGVRHEVTTPREQNESPEDWAARHKAAVEALKALYPPA
jgi:hypothetical protein